MKEECEEEPDSYLASKDSYNVEAPRRVWRLKRLCGPGSSDWLLARIDPPIVEQESGSVARKISIVLLATRHNGTSLFPITQWPVSVHVARPLLEDLETRDTLHKGEFRSIAWAELYKTEEDAHKKSLRGA
jgi:hypothetical protein